jgi:hypothetical protein
MILLRIWECEAEARTGDDRSLNNAARRLRFFHPIRIKEENTRAIRDAHPGHFPWVIPLRVRRDGLLPIA